MALKPVVISRSVVKRVDRNDGSVTLTNMYECKLSCGHLRRVSGLVHSQPPKKLKCKTCTKGST